MLVSLVTILGACNQSSSGEENGKKTKAYEFGLVMPQTGSSASFGNDQVTAALWAVDDINKNGGIDGVPLKALVEDSQADPKRAITGYQKVVSVDKAPLVVTAWSSVVKALSPLSEQNKTLMFSVGANDPKIKELGKFTRTTYPLADIDITAMAKYSYDVLGKRKAAVIYISNDTGKYAADIYKKVFEASGGEVVAFESHEPDKLEFSAQISKIKNANPDVIHIQSLVGETPQIISQIREKGINAQITTYSTAENPELVKQAGDAAEGVIYTSLAPDLTKPEVKEFFDRWNKEEGRMPNGAPYTEYLYDIPYMVKAIIEKLNEQGKPITGENALAALNDLGSITTPLTGETIFNKDGSVSKPVYIKKIEKGQFVLVDTIEAK